MFHPLGREPIIFTPKILKQAFKNEPSKDFELVTLDGLEVKLSGPERQGCDDRFFGRRGAALALMLFLR